MFAQSLTETPASLTQALDQISNQRMVQDIDTLSGAAFNGRQTGTPDDLASAEFVRHRSSICRSNDSLPKPLPLEVETIPTTLACNPAPVSTTTIGTDATLEIALSPTPYRTRSAPTTSQSSIRHRRTYRPPSYLSAMGLSTRLVGGMTMRMSMSEEKSSCFFEANQSVTLVQVSHADKVRAAHAHGALGYLTATGPILNAYEARRGVTGRPSAFYGLADPGHAIPGAWISTARAGGNTSCHPTHRRRSPAHAAATHCMKVTPAIDVDGYGRDDALAQRNARRFAPQCDHHLARKRQGAFRGSDRHRRASRSFRTARRPAVRRSRRQCVRHRSAPGSRARPQRTIDHTHTNDRAGLIQWEEQGLLGSTFYVNQPIVPLRTTTAMVNIDHAAVGNGRLTIGLTGMEKPLAQQVGQQAGLADRIDLFGFFLVAITFPFKEAGIPTVTVVSGGPHPHFHQPTDTAGTVNPEILTAVARYVLNMVWQLAEAP